MPFGFHWFSYRGTEVRQFMTLKYHLGETFWIQAAHGQFHCKSLWSGIYATIFRFRSNLWREIQSIVFNDPVWKPKNVFCGETASRVQVAGAWSVDLSDKIEKFFSRRKPWRFAWHWGFGAGDDVRGRWRGTQSTGCLSCHLAIVCQLGFGQRWHAFEIWWIIRYHIVDIGREQ